MQAAPVRGTSRPDGRDGRPPRLSGRYGLLLLVLIVTYLLSAFSAGRLAERLPIVLFAVVLLLALRTSPLSRRGTRLLVVIALAGSVAAAAAAMGGAGTGLGLAETWNGLILLLTAVLIVRRVLAQPTVSMQSIYGALSAYLIIGLMFAACYAAMERLGGAPFFAGGKPATTQTFQYFSFTTLTTLGYGDFTAAGNGGRAVAVIEALAGQVFLATLVARLVSAFRASGEPARPAATRRWPPRTTAPARVVTPYRPARNHPARVRSATGAGSHTARGNGNRPFQEKSQRPPRSGGGHEPDGC